MKNFRNWALYWVEWIGCNGFPDKVIAKNKEQALDKWAEKHPELSRQDAWINDYFLIDY